ncbi:MAG: MFS transporter [Desulfomonile tiedjei]|uniref:MFS transporter n=1 Tax=Desulfomonile tiedjei TaxID=2358 RepID=A0A9D6Z2H3_9BACT|nr:MFS transporter [Desulfomonile tiedjei]
MKKQLHAVRRSCDISPVTATKFVVLIGVVSLFSDFTYEGARSITGPFLATLGASATVVGVLAGFGELVGYALRLASGYFADKTRQYWAIVFLGYGMNLLAVPLLALAGHWEIAAILMVAERMGKAVRTPARDVMLSCASDQIGRGWGFGLHEALDQMGAVLGPLVVAAVFHFRGDYQSGFGLLLIPALIALSVLFTAYKLYPNPQDLEPASVKLQSDGFPKTYWFYVIAIGCVAAGYADFPLVAYHFKKVSAVPDYWIPIFYAVAMGVDALAALLLGRLFDRLGFSVMIIAILLSSFFAPLVFMGGFYWALAGMALWGVGMGAQESIMRAAIAGMVPTNRLGFAFGVFNTGYGLFWFVGSAFMGILYDFSLSTLIVFSVASQLISVPILLAAKRKRNTD